MYIVVYVDIINLDYVAINTRSRHSFARVTQTLLVFFFFVPITSATIALYQIHDHVGTDFLFYYATDAGISNTTVTETGI